MFDNNENENPLFELIDSGDLEMFKSQVVSDNLNYPDETGMTPLMYACELEESSFVDVLLTTGANKNLINDDRETALIISINNGNDEIINSLLNKGGNIDLEIHDEDGNTAVMIAAMKGDVDNVEKLIQYGASISLVNNDNLNIKEIVKNQIDDYNAILGKLSITGGRKSRKKKKQMKQKKKSKRVRRTN